MMSAIKKSTNMPADTGWVENCSFVKLHKRCLEEIVVHKWIESEKAGFDIGWAAAKQDWHRQYARDFQRHFFQQTS